MVRAESSHKRIKLDSKKVIPIDIFENLTIDKFEILKIIGKGSFGTVKLVRTAKKVYALKCL